MQKILIFFNVVTFIVFNSVFGLAQNNNKKEWTWVDYLDAGVKILEFTNEATKLYDHINSKDPDAVLVFTTNVSSNVEIYLNNNYVGKINNYNGYSLRVSPGDHYYKAKYSDGTVSENYVYAKAGTQYNLNLTFAGIDTKYTVKRNYGTINGNKVNLRSSTDTEYRDNILLQLYNGQRVELLGKKINYTSSSFKITTKKSFFEPISNVTSFYINKGISVKVVEYLNYNRCKVLLQTEKAPIYGIVECTNLKSIENSTWYKVKYGNKVGWVFGQFINEY